MGDHSLSDVFFLFVCVCVCYKGGFVFVLPLNHYDLWGWSCIPTLTLEVQLCGNECQFAVFVEEGQGGRNKLKYKQETPEEWK